ncbi:unnamed protein product [Ambrosiozyma monospora]|uniref:Unnamed protein product n=1 Tax=Ambrosiozyma monospora TaxID=43982 RepID=A0ACB5SVW6_AMBMO|nr:unnamed protein product [Ambrosiozyma monospora]
MPCVAKESFLQNNTGDRLSNPESLLLLRCVLFMGCFVSAKTPKERQEAVFLYEKANMLCSANLEQVGVYIVTSLLILKNTPKPALMDNVSPEDQLCVIVQTARIFGMDKDADNDETLTIEEKQVYKIMFWILVFLDKLYALTFSKNFYIDTKNKHNGVKRLTKDDFSTIGVENPENNFLAFVFELGELMDTVSELQKKANLASLKFEPFTHHVEEVDQAIKSFSEKMTKSKHEDNTYTAVLQIFVHSLNIVMQRVNLLRMFIVCDRAVHTVVSTRHLESELNQLCSPNCWESLKDSVFALCKFGTENLLNYNDALLFSQNTLCLCFLGMCGVITFLYYTDEETRNTATKLLNDAIPVVAKLKENHSIIWPMSDAYYVILTDLMKDPVKLVEYMRSTIVIPQCERLWRDIVSNPNLKLMKTIVLKNLPLIEHPFMTINEQVHKSSGADETIRHQQETSGITGSSKDANDSQHNTEKNGQFLPAKTSPLIFNILNDIWGVQFGDTRTYYEILQGIGNESFDMFESGFGRAQRDEIGGIGTTESLNSPSSANDSLLLGSKTTSKGLPALSQDVSSLNMPSSINFVPSNSYPQNDPYHSAQATSSALDPAYVTNPYPLTSSLTTAQSSDVANGNPPHLDHVPENYNLGTDIGGSITNEPPHSDKIPSNPYSDMFSTISDQHYPQQSTTLYENSSGNANDMIIDEGNIYAGTGTDSVTGNSLIQAENQSLDGVNEQQLETMINGFFRPWSWEYYLDSVFKENGVFIPEEMLNDQTLIQSNEQTEGPLGEGTMYEDGRILH